MRIDTTQRTQYRPVVSDIGAHEEPTPWVHSGRAKTFVNYGCTRA